MTTIEQELKKILKDHCPIQKIGNLFETSDHTELNQDLLLESIEVLKMHEGEIRKIRHNLELNYQSEVLKRYFR